MNANQFKNLALSRQACRNFNGKEIESDILKDIVDLARFAPSACNSQPWKMYCVQQEETKKAVLEALQEGGRNAFLSSATAFIVITEAVGKLKEDVLTRFSADHFVKYDIGELTAYITLMAKAHGVDSCVIGWINKEKLIKAVGYPQNESCSIVVALGYSDIPVREKIRKPIDQTVKFI